MIECEICKKEFSKMGIATHMWRSHGEGKNHKPSLGKVGWNKGLTKDTDSRIEKTASTFRVRLQEGKFQMWQTGKTLSENHKASIRSKVVERIENENWHSYRKSKSITYKEIHFDSGWEVKLAQWFDKHQIEWVRNREHFSYEFNGNNHIYFPDFYVPGIDCFVEVKGRTFKRDEAKWKCFPKKLVVLKLEELRNAKII